jgi:hypothetical protein
VLTPTDCFERVWADAVPLGDWRPSADAAGRSGVSPVQRNAPRYDPAVADPPARARVDKRVLVGDGPDRAVGVDPDDLGPRTDGAVGVRGDDDVGDVVAERVAVTELERGHVVDDRRCEQGVEPVEIAVVEDVSVERDQLDDRAARRSREIATARTTTLGLSVNAKRPGHQLPTER